MPRYVNQDDDGLHFSIVVTGLPAMNEHPVDIALELVQVLSRAAREYAPGAFAMLERPPSAPQARKEGA